MTAGVALAPAALPASPAQAASDTGRGGAPIAATYPGSTAGQLLSAPGAVTLAEQREVERYWSAQRRARAFGARTNDHADAAPLSPGPAPPAAGDSETAASDAPPPPSAGTPYTRGGLVTTTTGRLFATIGGSDYACSASVVSSPSRDLVVTAGHCVHGGSGEQFARNVIFIPGFDNGAMPYGIWTARRLTVTSGWARQDDFDVDTGFALFNPSPSRGRHLEDTVGSQGIAFDLPGTYPQYTFGYPRLPPYDGSQLVYCAGPGFGDPYGSPSIGVACRMTAGASGGPLLTGLGRLGSGHGWVDGVVSYAYAGVNDKLYGTHFGDVVKSLYYQSYRL
ncbi:hypothetical protein E0F15_06265 [Frankia sp. B2]|nr:hypothetical protein E0F15_06265 [Frankia sp. B2]